MLLQQQDERNGQSKPKRAAEIYEVICNQISSENDLLNQRVNWLVISQSFLFSAYASLLNAPKEAKDAVVAELQTFLLWMIPSLAVSASIIIYLGALGAIFYMGQLRKSFESYPPDSTTDGYPPIQEKSLARKLGQLPPTVVPLLFIGTWVSILIVQFVRAGYN